MDGDRSEQISVEVAAERLGVTVEAVRKRISRRSLASVRVGRRTFVLWRPDTDGTRPVAEPAPAPSPANLQAPGDERSALVIELRTSLEDARRRLDQSVVAEGELRRLLAAAEQDRAALRTMLAESHRVLLLSASSAPDSPPAGSGTAQGDQTGDTTSGQQEAPQAVPRGPWWKFW